MGEIIFTNIGEFKLSICTKIKTLVGQKIHDNGLNAQGVSWDGFINMKCITTMNAISGRREHGIACWLVLLSDTMGKFTNMFNNGLHDLVLVRWLGKCILKVLGG